MRPKEYINYIDSFITASRVPEQYWHENCFNIL